MKKIKGFTLIELIIVVVIIWILIIVFVGEISSSSKRAAVHGMNTIGNHEQSQQKKQYEGSCVSGFKVLQNGNQLLNEQGGGISCSNY